MPPYEKDITWITCKYVAMFLQQSQVQETPQNEQLGGRTSSSSVDLLKEFVYQNNRNKKGGSLSDAMDALGEWRRMNTQTGRQVGGRSISTK